MILNKLNPDDIDEKIHLNHKSGIDIWKLREYLVQELKDCRWVAIRCQVQVLYLTEDLNKISQEVDVDKYHKLKDEIKDFQWEAIRANIQSQSFMEQIEHIEKRIKEIEARPNKDNPFGTVEYKEKLIPATLLR